MKSILVPTDFSYCAREALASAILFAKQFDSSIHLLHVITPTMKWQNDQLLEAELNKGEAETLERAEETLGLLSAEFKDVNIIPKVRHGAFTDVLSTYCNEQDIDLIIMGSHGIGGKQEFFIGSNTQKVIRKVHTNTLVVKSALKNLDINKVVFASNFDVRDKRTMIRFKEFVAPFSPKVHLVHINTDPFFGLPYVVIKELMEEAKELFAPLYVETHFLKGLSVDEGVRHIAQDIQADLIGISNHIKHPLKRIFSGSSVEALVNHSALPVLSLDYVEENS